MNDQLLIFCNIFDVYNIYYVGILHIFYFFPFV